MTFAGWVAMLAGWITTEVGRQPWIVYEALTVAEVVAPHPAGKVGGTLGFVAWGVMYFVHPAVGKLLDTTPGSRPYIFASMGLLPLVAWAVIAVGWGRRR